MDEIDHDFAAGGSVAEAAGRERDALLACFQHFLGHDLPNCFVGAQGLARLILANLGSESPEQLRALLEQLADLVRLTDEEVRHLAALGRLIQDPGRPTPVDLGELCREAAAAARWLCGQPPVVYHISDLPVANVPVRLVREAVLQVLRAAFAAGLPDRPLRVEVAGEPRAEEVVLHVNDDGRGLSPEQLRRLADLWARGLLGTPGRAASGSWSVISSQPTAAASGVRSALEPGDRSNDDVSECRPPSRGPRVMDETLRLFLIEDRQRARPADAPESGACRPPGRAAVGRARTPSSS